MSRDRQIVDQPMTMLREVEDRASVTVERVHAKEP